MSNGGEWRYERLWEISGKLSEEVAQLTLQLAAEREKDDCTCDIDTICRVHGCPKCYDFQKQLDAEREQSQKRAEEGTKIYLQLTLLEKQLAAEQARCYNDGWVAGLEARDKEMTESERDACHRAEAALAAERENAEKAAVRAEQAQIQLAAAVEALKVARKQLALFNHIYATAGIKYVDAALEKIVGK